MNEMTYTVTEGNRVIAKFVSASDAEIFANALHAAIKRQDKAQEQIAVETAQRVIYIAGKFAA